MKRKLICFFLIIFSIFVTCDVLACEHDYKRYSKLGIEHAYVVGDYVFDLDNGFTPTLEDFAIAARTIKPGEDEYVYEIQIYEKYDYFSLINVFTGEEITDTDKLKLDLSYVYRASIRGASTDDYDVLVCEPDPVFDVDFSGLITSGENEYKDDASRVITIDSSEGIEDAKYCVTLGASCKPDIDMEINGNPADVEIPYGSEVGEQRVCYRVTDKIGNDTGIVCDEVTVKVDKTVPSASVSDNFNTIIKGEPHPAEDLFEVEFGPGGGSSNYYYYDPETGEKFLFNDTSELPEGNVRVEISAKGKNGLVTKIDRVIEVKMNVVTYDFKRNGGSAATSSSLKVGYNEKVNLKVTAEKLGYEFVGWNTDPDATEAIGSFVVEKNTILYAIYKRNLSVYFDVYTTGDVTASVDYDSKSCTLFNNDVSCIITTPKLSPKIGYEVLGFSKTKGSTVAEIKSEEEMTISQELRYYSVARKTTPITGTFNYYEDNDVKKVVSKCYLYNGATSCEVENIPNSGTYLGKESLGYTTDLVNPKPETNFVLSSGKNYYAYYQDEYTLKYISGINKSTKTDVSRVYYFVKDTGVDVVSEKKKLLAQDAITGFNRIGWREDTKAIDETVKEGTEIEVNGDLTYYGVYETNVTLSYAEEEDVTNKPDDVVLKSYYNSGSQKQTNVVFQLDDGLEIKKTDYIFSNWVKDGVDYAPGSDVETSEDVVFTSKWSLNGVKIVYNYSYNGGTKADKSSEVYLYDSGTGVDVTKVKAYKVGWTFMGWSKTPNATSGFESIVYPTVNPGEDSELVLYASYKKDINVKFNIQDDTAISYQTDSMLSCTLFNNDKDCNITIPGVNLINDNYEFLGWNKDAKAEMGTERPGDIIVVDSSATYNSITKNLIPLVANYNYYDGTERLVDSIECYRYNKSTTCETHSTINNVQYENGVFAGWSTSPTAINLSKTQVISRNTEYYGTYDRVLSVEYNSGVNYGTTVTNTALMHYLVNTTDVTSMAAKINLGSPQSINTYAALGWREDGTATTAEHSVGATLEITNDVKFYAVYQKALTLTYDVLGGTPKLSKQTKTVYYNTQMPSEIISASFTLANDIEKSGWTFSGWLENSLEGKHYNAGDTISINKDTTVYADWRINYYYVEYDYKTNGGSDFILADPRVETAFNEPINLSYVAFKEGYEFVGWTPIEGGTEPLTEMLMPSENVKLYAIFKKEVKAKWIVIDQNAVSIENQDGDLFESETVCELFNNDTKCGMRSPILVAKNSYTAIGWTTKQASDGDATELELGAGQTFETGVDVIYYSITKKTNPLVGTFYYYGLAQGSTTPDFISTQSTCTLFNGATTCTLQVNNPSEDYNGSLFDNWSSSSTTYEPTDLVVSANKDFYARYVEILTVSYYSGLLDTEMPEIPDEDTEIVPPDITDALEREFMIGKTSATINNPKYVFKDLLTHTGYTKVGWRTDHQAIDKQYSVGEEIELSTGLELFGIYTRKITLSYDSAGGSSVASQSHDAQFYNASGRYATETFTLANAPTRTGYTFSKWVNGSTKYDAGASIQILKDTKVTAEWTANSYTIKYNGNGHTSGSMTDSIHYYDTAKALTANSYKKDYYTFAGWNTKADGSGTSYSDRQSIKNLTAVNNAVINLYAQWNRISQKVIFHNYDGSMSVNDGAWAGEVFGSVVPPNTDRTGYTFIGWYTSETGGTKVEANYVFLGGALNVYARYTPNTYKLTLNAGAGGSVGSTTQDILFGGTATVKVTTDTGYYVSKATCSDGYTISLTTGTSAVGKLDAIVSNNLKPNNSTCSILFSSLSYPAVPVDTTYDASRDEESCGYYCSSGCGQCYACGSEVCGCELDGGVWLPHEGTCYGDYYCPDGGTLNGSKCTKTELTCPNGGTLSGTMCKF